jgi:hypothetical protein
MALSIARPLTLRSILSDPTSEVFDCSEEERAERYIDIEERELTVKALEKIRGSLVIYPRPFPALRNFRPFRGYRPFDGEAFLGDLEKAGSSRRPILEDLYYA